MNYIYEVEGVQYVAAMTKEEFVAVFNEKFDKKVSADDVKFVGEHKGHVCTGCKGENSCN